jgi:PIN domain nuclease of toxin-antitoxin system
MTQAEGVLLDTCAIIWLFNGEPLAPEAEKAIVDAGLAGGIHISPASAWEIGMLARPRGGRNLAVTFLPDPKTWFGKVVSRPGVRLAALSPGIAIDSSHLPEPLHADPADRLLISTARHLAVPIVTRDRRILDYAAAGHVQAMAC